MTIAQQLVDEGLAACANVLPAMQSIYKWKGKIASETECLVIIKGARRHYKEIERRTRELHPYELPEIIAVPIVDGLAEYLRWLDRPE